MGVAVDGGEFCTGQSVEEMDAPVVAAASGGDERGLPGREGDGFAGGVEREGVFLSSEEDGEEVVSLGWCGRRSGIGRINGW